MSDHRNAAHCTVTRLDLLSALVTKISLLPGGLQVIRIDLYKLPDINEECHERERERSEQREYNKYMFIYKESPERDLLPLSSEIRIKLTRPANEKKIVFLKDEISKVKIKCF